jgi:ankyrin repeat protein
MGACMSHEAVDTAEPSKHPLKAAHQSSTKNISLEVDENPEGNEKGGEEGNEEGGEEEKKSKLMNEFKKKLETEEGIPRAIEIIDDILFYEEGGLDVEYIVHAAEVNCIPVVKFILESVDFQKYNRENLILQILGSDKDSTEAVRMMLKHRSFEDVKVFESYLLYNCSNSFDDELVLRNQVATAKMLLEFWPAESLNDNCKVNLTKLLVAEALSRKDTKEIELMLEKGVPPNDVIMGVSMTFEDNSNIIQTAIKHGGSADTAIDTLMRFWESTPRDVSPNSSDMVSLLARLKSYFAIGASVSCKIYDEPLLFYAVKFLPLEVVMLLIEAGADINAPLLLRACVDNSIAHMAKVVIDNGFKINISLIDGTDSTPLLITLLESYGCTSEISDMLFGSSVDLTLPVKANGEIDSMLGYFVGKGNVKNVKLLLKHGFDPNMVPEGGNHVMSHNISNREIFQVLVDAGADISVSVSKIEDEKVREEISDDITNGKRMEAVNKTIKYFVTKQVAIWKEKLPANEFGLKFLSFCEEGDLEAVQEFVRLGIDPQKEIETRNTSRVTRQEHPFSTAAENDRASIVKYFLETCKVDPVSVKLSEVQDGRHHTLKRTNNGVTAVLQMDIRKNRNIIVSVLEDLQRRNILNDGVITHFFQSERDDDDEGEKKKPTAEDIEAKRLTDM